MQTVHAGEPWLSGWTKSSENPVLSLSSDPEDFDSHNMFAPAIAKHDGTYYLYYSGGPSGPLTGEGYINHQLGLATSTDGVNFTKLGSPLLPLGVQDDFHTTPALLRDEAGNLKLDDNGTWHMIYNGNRDDDVEHATSTDGINWTKDSGNPIFQNAYAPNLLQVGDEYRMYYIHKPTNGDPWEVHLATGPDLHSLTPIAENPVLTNTQSWEDSNLFYPYVFKDDDTWVMFYAGYWDSGTSATKTAIGSATSTDGVHWTKYENNPILTPTNGSSYDSVYVSSQAVLRDDGEYKMYYAGRIDSIHKYFSIGLATLPDHGDPLKALIHPATGEILLRNESDTAIEFDNYWIQSPAGALLYLDGQWNSLDDQNYDANGSGTGQSWDESGGASAFEIAESFLLGTSMLDPGESVSIGKAYNPSIVDGNITLKYHDVNYASDYLLTGTIEIALLGDMNDDGDLTEADVPLFVQALTNRAAFEANPSATSISADFIGDFDGNGLLDFGDVGLFSQAVANAASASGQGAAVPEPASALLIGLASSGLIATRRRRSRSTTN